jgi:hypothetical protein
LPRSLLSTFTTPLYLSFFGRSDCAPGTSLPSFPGRSACFTSAWTNLDDWLTPRRRMGLGTDDDAMMMSRLGILPAWPARRDAEDDLTADLTAFLSPPRRFGCICEP